MFGLADNSQSPALGYMEVVARRDAATLLPIINAHTAPGTIVHSDEWAAYRSVQNLSYVSSHGTVNHSLTFVDPTTGVHSQNVGSYWCRVKTKLKRMRGCHSLTSSPAIWTRLCGGRDTAKLLVTLWRI